VLPRFRVWKSLEIWQQRAGLGNSPRLSRTTSFCPPQPMARSACAVSLSQTPHRPRSSTALAMSQGL
jgi:hypothetical protein